MQVSDVGFNVRRERSICILAAQMADADRMFCVPLLASLFDPASACVPVQLAQPTVAWHGLTWNYCVWEPQTISHILHLSVVVFIQSANQSLNGIFPVCAHSWLLPECISVQTMLITSLTFKYLSHGCENERLTVKANRSM